MPEQDPAPWISSPQGLSVTDVSLCILFWMVHTKEEGHNLDCFPTVEGRNDSFYRMWFPLQCGEPDTDSILLPLPRVAAIAS